MTSTTTWPDPFAGGFLAGLRSPLPVPPSSDGPRRLRLETVLILLVSLGASAIWSVLSILRKLGESQPLSQQTTSLNVSRASTSWLDLTYQLVDICLALVQVAFALFLLARDVPRPRRFLGFDAARPWSDTAVGLALAAVIGIPGLGLYLGARAAGFNTQIAASALDEHWWTIPVLILFAVQNAVLEEVIMLGYLFTRWSQSRWRLGQVIVVSALIRGSYHLYQGFGGFVGNVAMGLILGVVFARTRRVMPMVIAHAVLDIVAFVGYAALHDHVSWL